jgi:hypothetical protein
MGEAKRRAAYWTRLFPDTDSPVRMAISRAGMRPLGTAMAERQIIADVAAYAAADKPLLCFNPECSTRIRTVTGVLTFLKTSDDPNVPAMVSCVCESCAARSDDELRQIMREIYGPQYGLDQKHWMRGKGVQLDLSNMYQLDAGGVPVLAARKPPIPTAPLAFIGALGRRELSGVLMSRNSACNCHQLVRQIRRDLQNLGIVQQFSFKHGHSELLKNETYPEGAHSWIEAEDWAIDASNGAFGNPVLMIPAADYRALWQLTNISDITEG